MMHLKAIVATLGLSISASLLSATTHAASDNQECPSYLNHEFRKLHSQEKINLCDKYQNKPLVLVNTASHCGYTKQFGDLEKLYQKYKDDGVEVIGFASDDFNQEAKDEKAAASICYKNYGVTFTMLAPTSIKGDKANPVFAHLGEKTQSPSWNFNKYILSKNGVEYFGSSTKPLSSPLEKALKKALN